MLYISTEENRMEFMLLHAVIAHLKPNLRFPADLLSRAAATAGSLRCVDSGGLSLITAGDGQEDGQSAAPLSADSRVIATENLFSIRCSCRFSPANNEAVRCGKISNNGTLCGTD